MLEGRKGDMLEDRKGDMQEGRKGDVITWCLYSLVSRESLMPRANMAREGKGLEGFFLPLYF